MQREILFRGKSIEPSTEGKWWYGSLLVHGRCYYIFPENPITPLGIVKYRVDPETVGQYTGIDDREGENIFEGDHDKDGNCVVFCERCNGWQFAQIDIPTKDICIPCHCCDGNFMFNDIINQFEITGNIHDNKELLK